MGVNDAGGEDPTGKLCNSSKHVYSPHFWGVLECAQLWRYESRLPLNVRNLLSTDHCRLARQTYHEDSRSTVEIHN